MLPKDGWEPQERLDRISALKMFTTWAAFSEFKDNDAFSLRAILERIKPQHKLYRKYELVRDNVVMN